MSRDIYVSLSGATSTWAQMDIVANNMANTSTVGFKQDKLPFKVEGPNDHVLGEVYAMADEPVADFSDGAVMNDDDPLHFALQGSGFLAVRDGDRTLLTRDGRFFMNEDRMVVNGQGMPLLGEGGPIEVPLNETLRVGTDGTIYGSESGEIDKLKLVGVESAERIGDNLWEPTSQMHAAKPTVIQGALEGSNVDILRSMTELIEIGQYFEAYKKAMQSTDELDARINRLGGK